ncbi:MAG TPA: carbamoyltransferase HypF [Pirellulales bacterium]|jgi:hydrogenase maturation protein HypF|nr:carbamoyltransferase HypF [Pirellulales bacterium]
MECRAITVTGIVQGVGFRPFVFRLASDLGLQGLVRNDAGSVYIEIEGENAALNKFRLRLEQDAPPLAKIDAVSWRPLAKQYAQRDQRFSIAHSAITGQEAIYFSPDVAVCQDCLAELFDPRNRRFRYPFLNCTNCGPRLTIIQGAPYDRRRTTMAQFEMCAECQTEYDDPNDRRFHAQPTACPKCGPQLELVNSAGNRIETSDPLATFVSVLQNGQIGALKGLGGYHLVCDARNQEVVCSLRRRKQREEMPLAVMVGSIEAAEKLCFITPEESAFINSPQRPIVLLRRRENTSSSVCEAVAPGNPYLGVMLPYTPLHHLLLRNMGDVPLVMTSGNRSHEPIAYQDTDALVRLRTVADIFLRHNRPIHVRCDDSVTRIVGHAELPIRRSRGYAPQPIRLPQPCVAPILAVGGQFKGVFALGRNRQAFLSHHLGDLEDFEASQQFERDIDLYEELFQFAPDLIVHDLHPDYASTRYARRRAQRDHLPTFPVQHHHAHMASCMAENRLTESVIGVTFDGTGYGQDEATGEATIWGGEFLVGDYQQFCRAAHLRNVPMPGGDKAIHEPWRMALAYLMDAHCDLSLIENRISSSVVNATKTIISRRVNCPLTSSAGRLFDAVASIAGLCDFTTFEGQAAMQLEWHCHKATEENSYPFQVESSPLVIDTRPMIQAVAKDVHDHVDIYRIARRFHATLAAIIIDVCKRIRNSCGYSSVVLSGGVFMNAILTEEVAMRLTDDGFQVYRHRLVPPNDGGLSLGQLAVAAAHQQMPNLQTSEPAPVRRQREPQLTQK